MLAKMADIVFPSTTTLERDDISYGGSYSQNVIYAMKQVVKPYYESRDDYDVFEEMAMKVSQKAHRKFTAKKSKREWLEQFYAKSDAASVMSFDEFWQAGSYEFEVPEQAYKFIRHSAFREDPIKNRLRTESGKIQIFSQKFADFNLPDFKGHPIWIEPSEWLGNEKLSKKYPFHLLSPHPLYRIHSQLDNTWLRNMYKIQGREPVVINQDDAKKLGISHGEAIEVFNDRGRVLAGAFVSDKIMSGVVSINEGAWYDPEDSIDNPRFNAGHANVLTSSRPTSQMAQATSVNTCLVGVRKLGKDEAVKPYKSMIPPTIIGA